MKEAHHFLFILFHDATAWYDLETYLEVLGICGMYGRCCLSLCTESGRGGGNK